MKNKIWALIGICAVALSIWLLAKELRGTSIDEFWDSFVAISGRDWCLAVVATFGAYAALAAYDHLALMHLKRKVSWLFISLCSFTTYALAHNIGASVFSGALVRYRAYSSKGLTASEVGVLVAFCSFTFALGTLLLTGLVLLIKPDITERFVDVLPVEASTTTGLFILALVAIYVLGSWLKLRPLKIGSFELTYPRLPIVSRQLLVAPIELACAAAIVYFVLPEAGNPGYFIVLGIFLVSFSVALLSHAPGGIGVLELVFITSLPEMDPVDVLAALFVFRLLYLIIPLVLSLFVVLGFERAQLSGKAAAKAETS
ncbi:MAG: YbhN family protein [Aliihoeflea sp.]